MKMFDFSRASGGAPTVYLDPNQGTVLSAPPTPSQTAPVSNA
jgi:hypothetical protein